MITVSINGEARQIDAEPSMPLLLALRERLDLTGTKYGCGIAACGACTVHLDGEAVRACQITLGEIGAGQVTTIEGLSGRVGEAVRTAWQALEVAQCGYCQMGQMMQAAALLQASPEPSDEDIVAAMDGNVCRCATYHRIALAVRQAADSLKG